MGKILCHKIVIFFIPILVAADTLGTLAPKPPSADLSKLPKNMKDSGLQVL